MAEDYSYLGSGKLLIREYGAATPFGEIGNCSALNYSPQTDKKTLPNYTEPGGGTQNTVDRVTGVELAYTFHDFSPSNFARTLRGSATETASGSASAEAVVAYKGGFTPLAKIAKTITAVEPAGGGTPYVAGEDYELRDGAIYIPADSAIPNPVAGAANIDVDYTFDKQSRIEALVNPAKKYELLFLGLNEARSGKPVRVHTHKVSGGMVQQMAMLGEDFGGGEVTGDCEMDPTKTGVGVSKYFYVDLVV